MPLDVIGNVLGSVVGGITGIFTEKERTKQTKLIVDAQHRDMDQKSLLISKTTALDVVMLSWVNRGIIYSLDMYRNYTRLCQSWEKNYSMWLRGTITPLTFIKDSNARSGIFRKMMELWGGTDYIVPGGILGAGMIEPSLIAWLHSKEGEFLTPNSKLAGYGILLPPFYGHSEPFKALELKGKLGEIQLVRDDGLGSNGQFILPSLLPAHAAIQGIVTHLDDDPYITAAEFLGASAEGKRLYTAHKELHLAADTAMLGNSYSNFLSLNGVAGLWGRPAYWDMFRDIPIAGGLRFTCLAKPQVADLIGFEHDEITSPRGGYISGAGGVKDHYMTSDKIWNKWKTWYGLSGNWKEFLKLSKVELF